jgi:uncharacterized Tic20 family protein
MTEPPRPPGDGNYDPSSPPPAPGPYSTPGEASGPGYAPPPSSPGPQYAQPQYGQQPPPGYGPPPGGGYPGAGVPGVPPPGYATNEEKTWALVAHFGGAAGMLISFGVLGFVAPLIAYLAKGQESPTVRAHAVNALNFQALWSIIGFVSAIIGCFLLYLPSIAVIIISIVFGVIAGMKANEGQLYKYAMSVQFVK